MENFRLKVFRTVARHLNFRRAADELSLTQPAVTQQIKALEGEYGVSLFDRAGGRIALTASGQILLPFAEKLKTISEEAFEAVAKVGGTHAGRLSIGASQTIGQYLLPNFIAEFLRQYPRVEITAISSNTDDIVESLTSQKIQVALVEGPTLRKDIKAEPFMEDHMVLVVPAGHEWAEHEIEVTDLKTAALLTRELGSGSRRVIEQALENAGFSKKELRATMALDSTEGLLSAVEAGLGVAFVSRWAVRNQIALGSLRIVRIRGLKLSRMFSIAYPSGPAPRGNAGAFIRFILDRSQNAVPRVTGSVPKAKQAKNG